MALKDGLLTIAAAHFQTFDHGTEIVQNVPRSWNLEPGDEVRWQCAQFDGFARVVWCRVTGDALTCGFNKAS